MSAPVLVPWPMDIYNAGDEHIADDCRWLYSLGGRLFSIHGIFLPTAAERSRIDAAKGIAESCGLKIALVAATGDRMLPWRRTGVDRPDTLKIPAGADPRLLWTHDLWREHLEGLHWWLEYLRPSWVASDTELWDPVTWPMWSDPACRSALRQFWNELLRTVARYSQALVFKTTQYGADCWPPDTFAIRAPVLYHVANTEMWPALHVRTLADAFDFWLRRSRYPAVDLVGGMPWVSCYRKDTRTPGNLCGAATMTELGRLCAARGMRGAHLYPPVTTQEERDLWAAFVQGFRERR